MFEKVKNDKMRLQKKQHDRQQAEIAHVQTFIDKFRANAKRATLVQSRIKAIKRMDIVEEVVFDPACIFIFPSPERISPPVLKIDEGKIGYSPESYILEGVNMNVDFDTRIGFVGPNGAGKSTLIKALTNQIEVEEGQYFKHNRLRLGLFTQHHIDLIDPKVSALEQFMGMFPGNQPETIRCHLGSFGITGNMALRPQYLLSGGQKSRVAFAMITWEKPHILLLDEPTNHLDFDSISALIVALNNYEGGLIVVSHDSYFVSSVCDQLYVVKNKQVKRFDGDIQDYRKSVTQ